MKKIIKNSERTEAVTSQKTLLPCPFCGADAKRVDSHDYIAICHHELDCFLFEGNGSRIIRFNTADRWNNRPVAWHPIEARTEAKYAELVESANKLCNEMGRDGYQIAKLQAVHELRRALDCIQKGGA